MRPKKQERSRPDRATDEARAHERKVAALDAWNPKTDIGKKVKMKEITNINDVLAGNRRILEYQVVDTLVPHLESDLLMIGQSKGKFGGGAGRVFKQTQKKTKEGNKPSFATCAVVGNKDGLVGIGYGKAKETVPAREKAVRAAKLNLIAVKRGSGDWESQSSLPHTVPFKVTGKSGSVQITLFPAPVGTGLIVEPECKKILELAGIKDVWSKMLGHTATKLNVVRACFNALEKLSEMKIKPGDEERLHIVVGATKTQGFQPETQEAEAQ